MPLANENGTTNQSVKEIDMMSKWRVAGLVTVVLGAVLVALLAFSCGGSGDDQKACTEAGGTCKGIDQCSRGVGNMGNQECGHVDLVCCFEEGSCGRPEDFVCCSATQSYATRPRCINGTLACPTDWTEKTGTTCP
jgi:hypothetical protein